MSPQSQLKIVSTAQMREIDRKASEIFGIPTLILMEHAGTGTADIAERHFFSRSGNEGPKKILVVCGKGNNGGDGLVAARHLFNRGYQVKVILAAADSSVLTPDAKTNYEILKKMQVPVLSPRETEDETKAADLMIDAVFGTGLAGEIKPPFTGLIQMMNAAGKPILSIDIPSGLNSDTGEVMGAAVRASVTAVLGLPKQGLYAGKGPDYAGKIYVVDIGLPRLILP